MKTFHCNRCSQQVFFENIRCERCEALLGYVPDIGEISAFEPSDQPELWRSLHPDAQGRLYRQCDNYALQNVCNWMVPADEAKPLCRSCELTRVIPNLSSDENCARWYKLETAKRRLLYTLAELELPVEPKEPEPVLASVPVPQTPMPASDAQPRPLASAGTGAEPVASTTPVTGQAPVGIQPDPGVQQSPGQNPALTPAAVDAPPAPPALPDDGPEVTRGIAFEFLEDTPQERVLTGHDHGLITLNIVEADDAQREAIRAQMHEPYRTLLGHFRHEIGHYYFDLLVADTHWNEPFRAMFGDERADYGQALERHYREGTPPNWSQNFITAYASSHPWEDWAETWAHYLHMVDTLDTATWCGLKLAPDDPGEPTLSDTTPVEDARFDQLMKRWFALTYALNSLNRSLGMPDGYPFTLAPAVIEKLHFVHRVVAGGVPARQDLPAGQHPGAPNESAPPASNAAPQKMEQEMLGS